MGDRSNFDRNFDRMGVLDRGPGSLRSEGSCANLDLDIQCICIILLNNIYIYIYIYVYIFIYIYI